jgi:hypothetical protein
MAEFCGFLGLRTLRSSTFRIDNGSRERDALATFGLTAKGAIGLAGAGRTLPRRFAHVTFPNCITNADNHWMLHRFTP